MVTPQEQEKQRLDYLYKYTPFLFYPMGKRVLYIGGSPGKVQLVRAIAEAHSVLLLEAFQPNVEAMMLEDSRLEIPHFVGYHHGNVVAMGLQKLRDVFGSIQHVIWWHGPEHIESFELKQTLTKLEALAETSVILGCPYGVLEQGEVYGNGYEVHRTHWYPEDFERKGYDTVTIGERDSGLGSCIIAWKRRS